MNIKRFSLGFFSLALIAAGCASHPAKPKPTFERGWIGGHYERAKRDRTASEMFFGDRHTLYDFPAALTNVQRAGILTLALSTNTPAYRGGLREGDLILALGNQTVTNLPGFWRIITTNRPGATLAVKAFRDGKTADYNITVGREKYEEEGRFTMMLPGYVEPPHPIATAENPQFSLVAVGYDKDLDAHMEFGSVRQQFIQSCHPKAKQVGHDQDWRFWLAIFEVAKGKKILAQEIVTAPVKNNP